MNSNIEMIINLFIFYLLFMSFQLFFQLLTYFEQFYVVFILQIITINCRWMSNGIVCRYTYLIGLHIPPYMFICTYIDRNKVVVCLVKNYTSRVPIKQS